MGGAIPGLVVLGSKKKKQAEQVMEGDQASKQHLSMVSASTPSPQAPALFEFLP